MTGLEKEVFQQLRSLLRMPIVLYRVRMGWLLGQRFLLLTHVGRKSGVRRQTVLEVVRYEGSNRTCIVASGWGDKAQWFKNIVANPDVEVTIGTRTHRARARWMRREEVERELREYARRHPRVEKQLARFLLGRPSQGLDEDGATLAEQIPLVELRAGGIPPWKA